MKCLVLTWWLFQLMITLAVVASASIENVLNIACDEGDLQKAFMTCKSLPETAQSLHILASLELILNSNAAKAVALHNEAKLIERVVPPLAKLHLDGETCGGLSDLFYVAAVITKDLVDSNLNQDKVLSGLTTLITLTSDSGLHNAAEKHIHHALRVSEGTADYASFAFRSALMTPGVFESHRHINKTRILLIHRIQTLINSTQSTVEHDTAETAKAQAQKQKQPVLKNLDEFVLSPTFYFVYQGYNDRDILTLLHNAYASAYPILSRVEIADGMKYQRYYHQKQNSNNDASSSITTSNNNNKRKIKVGFVSSYFRRHSICKLFCGIMTRLNSTVFDVVAFSALQEPHEDSYTANLKSSDTGGAPIEFVTLGKTLVQNRYEVVKRNIDVLVYLDVGMEPSTVVWAAARLAPIQICLWGHPSTTGLQSIDYYVSSDKYHNMHHYPLVNGGNNDSGISSQINDEMKASSETETTIAAPATATIKAASAKKPVLRSEFSAQDSFLEQLVHFDSLGYYFERPQLPVTSNISHIVHRSDDFYVETMRYLEALNTVGSKNIHALLTDKYNGNTKIILCTQHLPKFHPSFDVILGKLLLKVPNSVIVLLDNKNKYQWRRTLINRWQKSFAKVVNDIIAHTSLEAQITQSGLHGRKFTGDSVILNNVTTVSNMLDRIVWLPSLTPSEYLTLMSIGDVSLDPFPFGGGVTTLEALAVCTPVVTLPYRQNVPSLAAGMMNELGLSRRYEDLLIASNEEEYIDSVVKLLSDEEGDDVLDSVSDNHTRSKAGNNDSGDASQVGEFVIVDTAGALHTAVESGESGDYIGQNAAAAVAAAAAAGGGGGGGGGGGETHWESLLLQTRREICNNVDKVFSQEGTVREWETLLQRFVLSMKL